MTSTVADINIQEVPISEIQVGTRLRKDLGDLESLADSIKTVGLLQPVGITEDKKLVFGERRIKAYELLGLSSIPARIVTVSSIMVGEYAENQVRKDFNVSERVAIGRAIEKEIGNRQGQRTDRELRDICPEVGPGARTREIAAKKAGFGSDATYRRACEVVEKASVEVLDQIDSGETSIGAAFQNLRRTERQKEREKRRAENQMKVEAVADPRDILPVGQFSTIMIDPPWDYKDEDDGDYLGRSYPTYATMPIDQIRALPVGEFADANSHLYLWITNRSLPKGFGLLESWGFRYITCITWCKPSIGMGNYFRGSTEHVLFGVKGSQPLKRKNVGTWFQADRGPGGHSSKPTEFYDLIESCSPGPYLEMFARSEREGWTSWGAEVNTGNGRRETDDEQ